jgi:hypothetical protein
VRQFSPEHLAALAVLATALLVAVRTPRAIPRRALAAAILGAFLLEYLVARAPVRSPAPSPRHCSWRLRPASRTFSPEATNIASAAVLALVLFALLHALARHDSRPWLS